MENIYDKARNFCEEAKDKSQIDYNKAFKLFLNLHCLVMQMHNVVWDVVTKMVMELMWIILKQELGMKNHQRMGVQEH